jgi:hypothetical protein
MKSPKRIKSDSSPQRAVEKIIREQLAKPLGWTGSLEPRAVSYGKEGRMEFDCYGEDNGMILLVEINARHGELKPAQQNKVLRDILKIYAKSEELKQDGIKNVRKVIVFTNKDAAKFLKGHSWAAEVAREFCIESIIVPLKKAQIKILLKAQKAQDLLED